MVRPVAAAAASIALLGVLPGTSKAQATGLQLPALACSVKKTIWVDHLSQTSEERISDAMFRIDRNGVLYMKAPDSPERNLGVLKKVDVDRWNTGTNLLVPVDLSFNRIAIVSDMFTLMTISYGDCVRTN